MALENLGGSPPAGSSKEVFLQPLSVTKAAKVVLKAAFDPEIKGLVEINAVRKLY